MKPERYPTDTDRFLDEPIADATLPTNALDVLAQWIEDAKKNEVSPYRFSLATSTFEGKPSVRVMALAALRDEGLVFHSNYDSRKAKHILQNPNAAALFYWPNAGRQLRIEGVAKQLPDTEADELFELHSKLTKLNAWALPQSQPVNSRKYLESLVEDFQEEFAGKAHIKRPPNWGYYILTPHSVEFWQGHPTGIHDRFLYTLFNGEWKVERLAP